MEIKLDEIEMLTILHGLVALYDQSMEYKDVTYDNKQDFLLDINKTRMLHNKLLIQAQNEGCIDKEVSLI
ncbi:MAG: hypothetical protein LLF98_08510 [Clostridium sp.]|uniref:hypothetical protein n=1 Tax=Clostridium sp. TaxID=1506 RepID=UPI0025BE5C6B|nr:hypothetical protein [Clostridium sp.]MCE5221292.1 hypothetical protein [Clostridium sp.]